MSPGMAYNPYGPGGGGPVETGVSPELIQAITGLSEDIGYPAGGIGASMEMPAVRQELARRVKQQPLLAGNGGGGLVPGVDYISASVAPALGAIPAAAGALGVTVPPAVMTALGIAAAGYAGWQALGGGEGEGLFGLDILGGPPAGGGERYLSGIPLGGPGLAEPPAAWVLKEWHVSYDWGRLQYYLVRKPNGRRYIAMYNTRTKVWKAWPWRTPQLAIIGKNMPSHKQLTRLRRNLSKQRGDADTILRLTSPQYVLTKARRRQRRKR